ncbi:hypothetical protein GCM10023115_48620 [Pontixanthobacter gangjinensis]
MAISKNICGLTAKIRRLEIRIPVFLFSGLVIEKANNISPKNIKAPFPREADQKCILGKKRINVNRSTFLKTLTFSLIFSLKKRKPNTNPQ